MRPNRLFLAVLITILFSMACQLTGGLPGTLPTTPAELSPSPTRIIPTETPLPVAPVKPGANNPDEPVFITGDIPFTFPFFLNSISEPFVLLEDQAGFVRRDREFKFALASQVIGPVELVSENNLEYSLALPAVPQGTSVDVDNDGQEEAGVQVFAVAYWSNTWGDPFLEERDGTGWSTAYSSTITDPEREDEIIGGVLVVWSPDDGQNFPTGFGEDGQLFTEDDPTSPVPAGYNLVDLNQEPFRVYKEARPNITLNEGVIAVNDFSQLGYAEAFQEMFKKVSQEYPFTAEKGIDWQALNDQFTPRVEGARSAEDFYRALRDFTYSIPDGHVNVSFNPDVFFEERGGGFGLVLTQLSDKRLIVTEVIPASPAEKAGILRGAEIITWDGEPVAQAIEKVVPYLGPYSTQHALQLAKVDFLGRLPPASKITITYKNPGQSQEGQANLEAIVEYDSFFKTLAGFEQDQLSLPIESYVLDDSGLGYIHITTFSDDYNLMARLWERTVQTLIDEEIPGLIIDLRTNPGGSAGLTKNFAGYFFDHEIPLYQTLYFNENTGKFEPSGQPSKIEPAPLYYEGAIAVLVSPDCVSACEGFADALQQEGRAIIVGHYPSAGAFGEIGQGQYKLPEEMTMQFPTGRPETPEGLLLIEGEGVVPDILVPITAESALGQIDALLEAAVQALLQKIR